MPTLSSIKRLHSLLDREIFTVNATLDYARVTDAIIALANAINDYSGEPEDWIYIGEYGFCCLSDLIPAAYWHYSEWHGGQWSKGYAALSALGQIFSPGMSDGPEPDSPEFDCYQGLNSLANMEPAQ